MRVGPRTRLFTNFLTISWYEYISSFRQKNLAVNSIMERACRIATCFDSFRSFW